MSPIDVAPMYITCLRGIEVVPPPPPPPPQDSRSTVVLPPPGLHVPELQGTERKRAPVQHLAAEELLALAAAAAAQNKGGAGWRWWTLSAKPLVCPLTGFPISLLPYPPFKLRTNTARPNPHKLVDGKYLAMLVISTGDYVVGGRKLEASDLQALDNHIKRCKLGLFRPGRALELEQEANDEELSEERRAVAAEELQRLRDLSCEELEKLKRIQGNRLMQLKQQLGDGSAGTSSDSHKAKVATDASSKSSSCRSIHRARTQSDISTSLGSRASTASLSACSDTSSISSFV